MKMSEEMSENERQRSYPFCCVAAPFHSKVADFSVLPPSDFILRAPVLLHCSAHPSPPCIPSSNHQPSGPTPAPLGNNTTPAPLPQPKAPAHAGGLLAFGCRPLNPRGFLACLVCIRPTFLTSPLASGMCFFVLAAGSMLGAWGVGSNSAVSLSLSLSLAARRAFDSHHASLLRLQRPRKLGEVGTEKLHVEDNLVKARVGIEVGLPEVRGI